MLLDTNIHTHLPRMFFDSAETLIRLDLIGNQCTQFMKFALKIISLRKHIEFKFEIKCIMAEIPYS